MPAAVTLDQICSEFRQEIMDRSLLPGTKLSESSLCRRWKVSRTPIREALRRLESEGLISSSRYKGFTVNPISMEDMENLYTIMISLDSLAGRLATPILCRDPKRLKALEQVCRDMARFMKNGDAKNYIRKNLEFHFFILHACGNPWLVRILENLHVQTNRFIVNALYIPRRMEKSCQEHLEILKRLRRGDEKGVERTIARHFRVALSDLRNELGKPF
ncbi:MAG: GntR family transcriptional regulator [Deltaproteobacteria bacterium]|nr:MAG: GntR family transcriptional regulator [Deltaproteobacteria bacterium]